MGNHNSLCDDSTMNFRNLKECMSHVLSLISKMKHTEYEQNKAIELAEKNQTALFISKR